MGMYDTIMSSYDLGPSFYNKPLQTKDLDCLCDCYWIDPNGRLFKIDYDGTQDWVQIPKEDRKHAFDTFKIVPNGNKGKVTPCDITQTIEVYPEKWDCHYAAYPRKKITFINGVLIKDYSNKDFIWKKRYEALKRWVKEHIEIGEI